MNVGIHTQISSAHSPTASQPPTAMKLLRLINGHTHKKVVKVVKTSKHQCVNEWGSKNSQGADVLIFGNGEVSLFEKPPHKGPNDLWVFLSKEPQSKLKKRFVQPNWDGMFNYSVTFNRKTQASFHIFRPIIVPITPIQQRYFVNKADMKALWMVSHCKTTESNQNVFSAREEYVIELSKHIPIDVFTSRAESCSLVLNSVNRSIYNDEEPNFDKYMFYLSFENSLCQDYITEKFWKVLESDDAMIPIALGGVSIEDYYTIAPPNSFIHVTNFSSPEALANHLKYIAKEPDAFNYYHQWRNSYRLNGSNHIMAPDRTLMYHGDYIKYICDLAYERPQSIWSNFSEEYGNHQCLDVSAPEDYCPFYNLPCKEL
ncbi:alpha-(1,3)-fucosyltransferase C-like [Watersipora subatra]|uniref:alpha-(1,3)-fucosyltransferase C-like n=1 Tax=Watersipora subatra TaxID=2589382 RepID=UPI00355C354A